MARKFSEETRRKLSEAKKGKPPNNAGKPQSEEHKRKKAEANRGSKRSEETKQKMREAAYKRISMSEETKQKISKTKTGVRLSEEHKKKMSETHKGHLVSEETRIKISISNGGNGELDKRYPNLGLWRKRNVERTPYCQFCFSEDNLEAHHIIPKAKFPQYHDEDWNCRILCRDCHIVCHKQGGY